MNITLLQFNTEEDAGDERGKDLVGLHYFGSGSRVSMT